MPFISTSLNLGPSVPFELCFVVRTEGGGCKMCPVKWARLSFKTLFDDDTIRIESSTYGASQTLRGVGVSLTITYICFLMNMEYECRARFYGFQLRLE